MDHRADFLLPSAAARLLCLSSARVRELCDQGELEALRTPEGVRLIPRAAVEALAEKRRQAAVAE
jgi:excisionase family DNA binding protein